ncbi:MAG: hypothetical protein Q7T17_01665 [Microbacterium sp.]|uniref:hypothetical protein n=1 Tax=Microbacterium sp. TaxID=51671 RepID=UPI002728C993|nr:hypothetical protein [Microbacterium sp.]MDO8381681.1 hypothetical protein [Microbacterium sp.]
MTQGTPVGEGADRERDDDRDAELSRLRLRAYGPDADIDSDPAARARLQELERMHRGASLPSAAVSEDERPVPPPPLPPEMPAVVVAPLVPRAEPGGSAAPAVAVAEPGVPAARTWSRRLGRWSRNPRGIAIAAVALVVVLALAIVPGLFTDRADASLRVDPQYADEQLSTDYRLFLRQIGADMEDFARFEDYAGLQVWGTPTDAPVRCVLMSDGARDVRALSCVPRGLDPVADMMVYPGSPVPGDLEELYPEAGDGTAVRFTLRGDSVDVRVVLADPALEFS